MEKAKHTPGPWEVDFGSNQEASVFLKNEGTIATIVSDLKNWEENAYLISASPLLLEALKDVLLYLTKPYKSEMGRVEIINIVQNAIAQAEGNEIINKDTTKGFYDK